MVPKNIGVIIFRCDHYAEWTGNASLGPIITPYGCLIPRHVCTSFYGSGGFYLFFMIYFSTPPHLLSLSLTTWYEAPTNEWNVTDELILMASDSISWNHEIRGWQIIWRNSHKHKYLLITMCNSRGVAFGLSSWGSGWDSMDSADTGPVGSSCYILCVKVRLVTEQESYPAIKSPLFVYWVTPHVSNLYHQYSSLFHLTRLLTAFLRISNQNVAYLVSPKF
jgi:hypothetical protein